MSEQLDLYAHPFSKTQEVESASSARCSAIPYLTDCLQTIALRKFKSLAPNERLKLNVQRRRRVVFTVLFDSCL